MTKPRLRAEAVPTVFFRSSIETIEIPSPINSKNFLEISSPNNSTVIEEKDIKDNSFIKPADFEEKDSAQNFKLIYDLEQCDWKNIKMDNKEIMDALNASESKNVGSANMELSSGKFKKTCQEISNIKQEVDVKQENFQGGELGITLMKL